MNAARWLKPPTAERDMKFVAPHSCEIQWTPRATVKMDAERPLSAPALRACASDIASEAAVIEADIEKFLDEALITAFRETPLHTMENVLEERRWRSEREERVSSRAKEFLAEEVAKERHARELRELEEAITTTKEPLEASGKEGGKGSKAGAPSAEDASWSAAIASAPFKLEAAGRSRDMKPYMANLTDFVTEGESSRNIRELQAENELLRKCLGEGGANEPKAFESYLRRARGGALG
jgi:hypothetical protein